MAYQFIQLTDTTVGAVATGALLPLGNVTRRFSNGSCCAMTFEVSTSGSDTITINESGYYKVSYVGSLTPAAAGELTLTLTANGVAVTSVTDTVAAADDTTNITFDYIVRVFPNCSSINNMPVILQVVNSGVALTGGSSNIIVEKIR